MAVFGITYRRLAIDGQIAAIRCQGVDPQLGLIGSAHVFKVIEVADMIERGEVFEFWPRIGSTRVSGGAVLIKRAPNGKPLLVEERSGGHQLLDLPAFYAALVSLHDAVGWLYNAPVKRSSVPWSGDALAAPITPASCSAAISPSR